MNNDNCWIPCQGVYADARKVLKGDVSSKPEFIFDLENDYMRYKRGYADEIELPHEFQGINSSVVKLCVHFMSMCPCVFESIRHPLCVCGSKSSKMDTF